MKRGVLETILVAKREAISRLEAAPRPTPRIPSSGVVTRLARKPGEALRLLTEIKLRSPSAGALNQVLSPPERALAYARAGASMISVLVDGPFFGGSFEHLASCREALDRELGDARPLLLCKEFVLHPVQLDHAVAAGADAVLLIARIVSAAELASLADEARSRGLTPLVEIATHDELDAALGAKASVIGVNARDLDTLKMDTAWAAEVLARIEPGTVAVHLSGLRTPEDVARVASGRPDAALIGEALMRQDDPTDLLRAMVRAASSP